MDMWQPFIRMVSLLLPQAETKIVFDRYHVVAHMNDAVDQVRRRENRELRTLGDDCLVGSKYLWLYGAERVPEESFWDFFALRQGDAQDLARMGHQGNAPLPLGSAHAETGAGLVQEAGTPGRSARDSQPVKKVAAMLRRHLPGVLAYFTHRITNSASEALNSTIQMIKKRAFGFRSFDNFRIAILFRCGGLQLHP